MFLLALSLNLACRDRADGDGDGVSADEDCNDADPEVFPGADELCNNRDDDCDGSVDEDALDADSWHVDADGDGYGSEGEVLSCVAVAGAVANGDDCDDTSASAHPGGVEICDGQDNDCDGSADVGAVGAPVRFADTDGDGFGDPEVRDTACDGTEGWVEDDNDCDDTQAAVNPDAQEICNDRDDDCDGEVDDDASDAPTWYIDADGDGYGGSRFSLVQCDAPSGYVEDDTDCDDLDASDFPGAAETCDGEDDDCDGVVDNDPTDPSVFYADSDGDGYGDPSSTESACEASTGYVDDKSDCDDNDADSHPGGTEVCDDADNDCDGSTDEDASDASTWYADLDGDGYGGSTLTTDACDQPGGYVSSFDDCDDLDSSQNPAATETCNDEDDDCDGSVDEGSAGVQTWYADGDGDGYGDPDVSTDDCNQPSGYVDNDDDCDDGDGDVNPDGEETCDGTDEDCNGTVDDDETTLGQDSVCPADSCYEVLSTRTDSPSDGVYWVDPSGGSAYEVWCDLSTEGGGWTLLSVVTNNDSAQWLPTGANWVTSTTLGDPTDPTVNADAKSQAFNDMPVDELMIVHAPSTVGLVSDTSCLGSNTLLTIFQRDSEPDSDCAWSCSVATVASPWSGQSYQTSTLGFRCSDVDATYYDTGGYLYRADNSFITTLNNASYRDYNFGLGSGENANWVDWDSTTADGGNGSDSTQVLVYGR